MRSRSLTQSIRTMGAHLPGRRLNFTQFLIERGTPNLDSMDHSALSPSGRVSGASRRATLFKEEVRLRDLGIAQSEFQVLINSGTVVDPSGRYWPRTPGPSPQSIEKARLLQRAAELRGLADRGMSPRKYMKEAERLEAEAAHLEG